MNGSTDTGCNFCSPTLNSPLLRRGKVRRFSSYFKVTHNSYRVSNALFFRLDTIPHTPKSKSLILSQKLHLITMPARNPAGRFDQQIHRIAGREPLFFSAFSDFRRTKPTDQQSDDYLCRFYGQCSSRDKSEKQPIPPPSPKPVVPSLHHSSLFDC